MLDHQKLATLSRWPLYPGGQSNWFDNTEQYKIRKVGEETTLNITYVLPFFLKS